MPYLQKHIDYHCKQTTEIFNFTLLIFEILKQNIQILS